MTQRFPIARYALSLTEKERREFIAMPLLRRDPMRAIAAFDRQRRRATS